MVDATLVAEDNNVIDYRRSYYTCNKCGHTWFGRMYRGVLKVPKVCPRCQSKKWNIDKVAKHLIEKHNKSLEVLRKEEEIKGGDEWSRCMFFDDTKDVMEVCGNTGFNVATIEVPLNVVDVTWRTSLQQITKYAAHPSERGCYVTMPLVLCTKHIAVICDRTAQQMKEVS